MKKQFSPGDKAWCCGFPAARGVFEAVVGLIRPVKNKVEISVDPKSGMFYWHKSFVFEKRSEAIEKEAQYIKALVKDCKKIITERKRELQELEEYQDRLIEEFQKLLEPPED